MENLNKPIAKGDYLIQKKEGKGGWSFVVISGIPKSQKDKLGLVRVHGQIDNYAIKQYNLLPMIGGDMLLPIKATIRKKINKTEGDTVQIVLYADDSTVVIPDEIAVCLIDFDRAYQYFLTLSESNKKYYIDWVEDTKSLETKAQRIHKMIERLENGLRFYDW